MPALLAACGRTGDGSFPVGAAPLKGLDPGGKKASQGGPLLLGGTPWGRTPRGGGTPGPSGLGKNTEGISFS